MKEIEIQNWDREKTYNWFQSFSDSTYSCNVKMDVTNLVHHVKETGESFFIDLLYIVVQSLNSIDEMRMRLVDGKPILYEDIHPAFTVMTKTGTFENVRHKNDRDFKKFYKMSSEKLEKAKNQTKIEKEDYNPENCYDEYYITCLPWIDFSSLTHPIPEDKGSQCIPRICWGKYTTQNDKYELMLNITVSHIFVDGYPLSKAFLKIQEMLEQVDEILK